MTQTMLETKDPYIQMLKYRKKVILLQSRVWHLKAKLVLSRQKIRELKKELQK